MKKIFVPSLLVFFLCAFNTAFAWESSRGNAKIVALAETDTIYSDVQELEPEKSPFEEETVKISDPIEPVNRLFYHFNDKFYFYLLKPVSRVYGTVIPEQGRIYISNFFSNLTTPIRLANELLQFKFNIAGNELKRFFINTTWGFLGFCDCADACWGIKKTKDDFGLTLGYYGVSHGFYLVLPILGPSSLRDGTGTFVDYFFDPVYYYTTWTEYAAVEGEEILNHTSLHVGEYEDMKKQAVDPYLFMRNAYIQYRKGLLKEIKGEKD